MLVNVDGDPVWSPIKENDLKFAVNSNWDIFNHEPTKTYYLRNEATWLKTSDLTGGRWTPAGKLPESFNKLPADDNWKDVKAGLPGKGAHPAPTVFQSTQPAELILLQGEPQYTKVGGNSTALGEQHRQRRVSSRDEWACLLPRGGEMVFGY